MSHRLALVNLSRFRGQDYRVKLNGKEAYIRPGEHVEIPHGAENTVEIVSDEDDKITSFFVDIPEAGETLGQTFPIMNIEWRSCRKPREFLEDPIRVPVRDKEGGPERGWSSLQKVSEKTT